MTAAARRPTPGRNPRLAKIHIARKELGLDEAVYRAILVRLTGKESAAVCSDAELDRVLEEFKRKGWTPARLGGKPRRQSPTSAPARRPADHPVARKARALWISLHRLGVVENPSESALEAFAKRQLKVDALAWADQGKGFRLIEALKAMAERAGWSQDVGDLRGEEAGALLQRRLETLLEERGLA